MGERPGVNLNSFPDPVLFPPERWEPFASLTQPEGARVPGEATVLGGRGGHSVPPTGRFFPVHLS